MALASGTFNPTDNSPASKPIALLRGLLAGLIFLNLVQLIAGFSSIEMRPPVEVLPMIGATIALGLIAMPLVCASQPIGYLIGVVFCLVSMIGMGPHKLLADNGMAIAPVAILGFVAEVAFIWIAVRLLMARKTTPAD